MKMIVQIGLPNENYEMQFGLAWSRKKCKMDSRVCETAYL